MSRAVRRSGQRASVVLLALSLATAVACSRPIRVVPASVPPGATPVAPNDLTSLDPLSSHTEKEPGVSLVPVLSKPVFVFGHPVPTPVVQPGSWTLTEFVHPSKRLAVTPLPSPSGTAAVHVLETSRTEDKWGALSTPAQRSIYARFAGDASLGAWLVLVSDVRVVDGSDPVPVTAYRWPRQAVETYAACGIPEAGRGIPWTKIDDCTDAFFIASQMVMVLPGARTIGQ